MRNEILVFKEGQPNLRDGGVPTYVSGIRGSTVAHYRNAEMERTHCFCDPGKWGIRYASCHCAWLIGGQRSGMQLCICLYIEIHGEMLVRWLLKIEPNAWAGGKGSCAVCIDLQAVGASSRVLW